MRKPLLATAAAAAFLAAGTASAAPNVVATILPVHSLTAAVMAGVATPTLLLPPGVSPHAYSLRPSEAAALESADLVVWVGEDLETFLEGPLETLAAGAVHLTLIEAPGMQLLEGREGGAWDVHDHGDHGHGDHGHDEHAHDDHAHHDHAHDEHAHGDVDAHIWLSIDNAVAMTNAIAATLGELDPANAEAYTTNAKNQVADLEALEADLAATLAPVREAPFIVFHDAYQYLETTFDLNAVGSITVTPEQQPGAARVAELRAKIEELDARCVFAEPQFEPRLVETLIEGTDARAGVLDPIGTDLEPGPDAYGALIGNLASSLQDCLIGSS